MIANFKKREIAIVTDSTAYLTSEERREWDIHVLPLSVIFGQESYRKEQDLTTADFYEKVKNQRYFQRVHNQQLVKQLNYSVNYPIIMMLLFQFFYPVGLAELIKQLHSKKKFTNNSCRNQMDSQEIFLKHRLY